MEYSFLSNQAAIRCAECIEWQPHCDVEKNLLSKDGEASSADRTKACLDPPHVRVWRDGFRVRDKTNWVKMTSIEVSERQQVAVAAPQDPKDWFALYTSAKHEKKAEQQLRIRGFETFLPLHTVTKKWKNRVTAKVELPLFAGYVFVKMIRAHVTRVLDISLVHSVIGNGREALALPNTEIDALRLGVQERQVDPHEYLRVGDIARVRSGAFAGLQGVVVRKGSQLRIVLSIDMIERSIAVHVTADELDFPLSPSAGKTVS